MKIIFTRREVILVYVYPWRRFQLFFCREGNRLAVEEFYGDEVGSALSAFTRMSNSPHHFMNLIMMKGPVKATQLSRRINYVRLLIKKLEDLLKVRFSLDIITPFRTFQDCAQQNHGTPFQLY